MQLKANPSLELDYIIAKPRMAHYMEHSAKIYEIYLKYNDILNMQYPNPEIEKDFPDKILREAQFAPFAVLTGYDDTIAETARQTDSKLELDEYEIEKLNAKLQYLENADEEYKVVISYFVSDKTKSGGAYVSKSGVVIKVREYERDVGKHDEAEVIYDHILKLKIDYFSNMHLPELPFYQAMAYTAKGDFLMGRAIDKYQKKWNDAITKEDVGYFGTTPFFISYCDDAKMARRAYYSYLLGFAYRFMERYENSKKIFETASDCDKANLWYCIEK